MQHVRHCDKSETISYIGNPTVGSKVKLLPIANDYDQIRFLCTDLCEC